MRLIFLYFIICCTSLAAHAESEFIREKVKTTFDIPLESSVKATSFIHQLQNTQVRSSTTAKRVERKAVLPSQRFQLALSELYTHPEANFTYRDKPADETTLNQTLTFYGASIAFFQKNTKTKIKLRARFYLQVDKNGAKTRTSPKSGFLELKIKNPLPGQKGVHKYRIKAYDDDILALYNSRPGSENFEQALQNIMTRQINKGEKVEMTYLMIDVIREFGMHNPLFTTPVLAISYHRESYQQDIQGHNIQLTIDRHVQAYLPTQPLHSLNDYLIHSPEEDLVYQYPDDVVVLELKEPVVLSQQNKFHQQSLLQSVRRFRQHAFCRAYVAPGFDIERNKGKAGTIRQALYDKYLTGKP